MGKTLFGLEFMVRGAWEFGEPGVLLSFEESGAELATNVASLGFDLPGMERDGPLVVDSFRVDAAMVIATGAFDLEGVFLRLGLALEQVGVKSWCWTPSWCCHRVGQRGDRPLGPCHPPGNPR